VQINNVQRIVKKEINNLKSISCDLKAEQRCSN